MLQHCLTYIVYILLGISIEFDESVNDCMLHRTCFCGVCVCVRACVCVYPSGWMMSCWGHMFDMCTMHMSVMCLRGGIVFGSVGMNFDGMYALDRRNGCDVCCGRDVWDV